MSMKQSMGSAGQEISGAWLYTTVVTILRNKDRELKKKTELRTQILAVNNQLYILHVRLIRLSIKVAP